MNESIFKYDERLDTVFLESLYENDNEHAAMIFEQFLLTYPQQMKEIDTVFLAGDISLLKQKIHKLKPTLSFVGLTKLTAQAEVIENKCAQSNDMKTLQGLYVDFKNNLNQLIPVVQTEFERLKN